MVSQNRYQPGDWVIYRKSKYSTHPGPRAQNVSPAQSGEKYAYTVDKYWVVSRVLEDGRLVLQTRRGKEHIVAPEDHDLHLARWWQRWLHKSRFTAVENSTDAEQTQPGDARASA